MQPTFRRMEPVGVERVAVMSHDQMLRSKGWLVNPTRLVKLLLSAVTHLLSKRV